jgi:hypothetical protein
MLQKADKQNSSYIVYPIPKPKRHSEILELIKAPSSRSEDKLILIYASYVNFMVRQYSKKRDQRRRRFTIVRQPGLLDGISSTQNVVLVYLLRPHMDEKKILSWRASYRFIRIT